MKVQNKKLLIWIPKYAGEFEFDAHNDRYILEPILRKDEIIIPRSNFIFKKDDTVVFLSKRDQITLVENMFRISAI